MPILTIRMRNGLLSRCSNGKLTMVLLVRFPQSSRQVRYPKRADFIAPMMRPQVVQPPPPPAHSQKSWPDALKTYVQKVYETCPPLEKPKVEEGLRSLIKDLQARGAIWTTDWNSMPLPE